MAVTQQIQNINLTRLTAHNVLTRIREGNFHLHEAREPLAAAVFHRLVNNVARSVGLPTGVLGPWTNEANKRLFYILAEPKSEGRKKSKMAIGRGCSRLTRTTSCHR